MTQPQEGDVRNSYVQQWRWCTRHPRLLPHWQSVSGRVCIFPPLNDRHPWHVVLLNDRGQEVLSRELSGPDAETQAFSIAESLL